MSNSNREMLNIPLFRDRLVVKRWTNNWSNYEGWKTRTCGPCWSGYHYRITLFNKTWTQVLRRFRFCLRHVSQKMKFSIKDFFSKCDQIRSFLENCIFCAVRQWSLLDIRLLGFLWLIIQQTQFIISIISIFIILISQPISQHNIFFSSNIFGLPMLLPI